MFYDQLKALCKEKGTTPTAFVINELGLSSSKITAWKNGSIPKYGTLEKIADFFQVPICFLFEDDNNIKRTNTLDKQEQKLLDTYQKLNDFDKGKLIERAETLAELAAERAAQEAKKVSKEKKKATEKSKPITIAPATDEALEQDEERLIEIRHSVYKVSAGCGFELWEGDNWETIEISDTPEARRADYALTISGDSMEPVYYDGDIVLVREQETIEMGQIGIFILDGSGYIKKYCGDHLVSLNEDYDDIPLSDYEDVRCSGRVIGRV